MSSLFGLDQSNRLVFVSEAPRGLACLCRCVVCNEPLIARQGSVREHHFAHASGREPCEVSHESLLHRYAKQVIQDAGGLMVPIDEVVRDALGLTPGVAPEARLALSQIEVEKSLGDVRPDLLGHTPDGVTIAIEIAYSSFCDLVKIAEFEQRCLPAFEIDLRAFTSEAFDAGAVREAVIEQTSGKTWLWPRPPVPLQAALGREELSPMPSVLAEPVKARLPEEIVTIAGRWVSIKEFPNGDIAVKVVVFDPDIVSMVKCIARSNGGRYAAKWRSWNIPRWRAEMARNELRAKSETVLIVLKDRPDATRADHMQQGS